MTSTVVARRAHAGISGHGWAVETRKTPPHGTSLVAEEAFLARVLFTTSFRTCEALIALSRSDDNLRGVFGPRTEGPGWAWQAADFILRSVFRLVGPLRTQRRG